MKAYAIAHLSNFVMGQPIATYLERIDATLVPFDGKFLVHGAELERVEGDFNDTVVIIEFPSIESARGWYQSTDYQFILPLRTHNADCSAFLLQGVADGYKATDVLKKMSLAL